MSSRSKARKRAIDLLYGADVRQITLAQAIAVDAERAAAEPARSASWAYARELVEGVDEHSADIDALIGEHAQGWTLARMPVLDRAILRLAVWELVYNDEVPAAVAISEAVESAKSLSTEDSASFVNGLLGAIASARTPEHRA